MYIKILSSLRFFKIIIQFFLSLFLKNKAYPRYIEQYLLLVGSFLLPYRAYASRFKSSTFMGVVFAETVRDKPT